MKSLEKLKELFAEFLAHGIEIEAGKRRFLLAAPDAVSKLRNGKRECLVLKAVSLGAARAEVRGRKRKPLSLKVPPNGILAELEKAATGMRMKDIASQLDVPWQGLIASLRHLKRRHKVVEANGFYFLPRAARWAVEVRPDELASEPEVVLAAPVAPAAPARASRKRGKKVCRIPGCPRDHYAKDLCNNHYNIERRREAASIELEEDGDEERRKAYRVTILNALREQQDGISLFNLGKVVNEKWQTLRQPANELVRDHLIQKRGKLYVPVESEDESENSLRAGD
jgi:hypothetical protein